MRNFKKINQLDAFENFIEFSCFTDQFLTGMDMLGEKADLLNELDFDNCELYHGIRKIEQLKHAIDAEFMKHVSFAKRVFRNNRKVQFELNLHCIINFDLDSWMEHVKMFYINLLSDSYVYNEISNNGLQLEEIEGAIEMMIELEENNIRIGKLEKENKYLN